jgi:hypothetical protein
MRFIPLFFLPFFAPFFLSSARAALDPATVSGDAQWVVHVDLNQLRQTIIGRELIAFAERQMPKPNANSGAAANPVPDITLNFEKMLATIGSVTGYGSNFVPDPAKLDGALVIAGTPDLRKIAESLVLQASIGSPRDVVEEAGASFDTYRLANEVYIGFPSQPVVLISKSKAQLNKAADVLKGSAPSLARNASSPLAPLLRAPGQPFVIASSVAPSNLQGIPDGPQARILQLTQAGTVALGENAGKTTAHLKLVAPSEASATKLQKIVEGMTAMLSLAQTGDRDLQQFLQSAAVRRDDRAITLDLAYSSERLIQLFNTFQAAQQQANRPPTPPPPAPVQAPARVVGKWSLPGAAGATPEASLKTHKLENVALVTSATITLTTSRNAPGTPGETGRIDLVEIAPAGGGSPLRFEAESMKLSRYSSRNAPFASGRRLIVLGSQSGNASFEFPGADGDYSITVRFVDEPDANTTMSVSVREPARMPESN